MSSLGPTDYNTLHTILAMATYGEDPTLGRPSIQNIQPIKVIFLYFLMKVFVEILFSPPVRLKITLSLLCYPLPLEQLESTQSKCIYANKLL